MTTDILIRLLGVNVCRHLFKCLIKIILNCHHDPTITSDMAKGNNLAQVRQLMSGRSGKLAERKEFLLHS